MFERSRRQQWAMVRQLGLVALLAGSSACAGGMDSVEQGIQEARRAVHQKCHSQYNSCRQAAGGNRGHQQRCQQDLDACLSKPATD